MSAPWRVNCVVCVDSHIHEFIHWFAECCCYPANTHCSDIVLVHNGVPINVATVSTIVRLIVWHFVQKALRVFHSTLFREHQSQIKQLSRFYSSTEEKKIASYPLLTQKKISEKWSFVENYQWKKKLME